MSIHSITKLKILIAIPTYKRAGIVTTIDLFEKEDSIMFVDSLELKQYKNSYPSYNIVEYKGSQGLTPKLNFILSYARKNGYDAIWKIDDDFTQLGYFGEGYSEPRITDKKRIYQVIERMAVMAKDIKSPLFVTAPLADIRRYSRNLPFSLFCTLKIGAYGLLIDNDLNFDERLVMKQDIDMCLQVLLNYRKLIVENRYSFYYKATMGSKGGVASYRTKEKETKMMDILRKKWGDNAFANSTSDKLSIYTLNIQNPFK